MQRKKPDYSKYTKEELIAKIKELEKRKKYGLVWDDEREPEKVVEQCKRQFPVLKEVKSKSIQRDPDKPTHILIEGDNYHALSVLNYTHHKAIDVIYIDPPYNTGAKDWKYNNNFVDINDNYRHSKWLSFMYHRLVLAKKLLSNQGVLICTIDHNEQAALGLLLEHIFPSKEKTCVTIIHNPSGIQGKNFSHNNEYSYFVYNGKKKVIANEERSDEDADVRPFMNTAKGRSKNYLRQSGYKCFYPIYIKGTNILGFGDVCNQSFHPAKPTIKRNDSVLEVYPIDSEGIERKWVFSRDSVESIRDELSVKYDKKTKFPTVIRTKTLINYKTVWSGAKFNAKSHGTQLLRNIIGKEFPFPKSLFAVEECIKAVVHNMETSIVLDFFAGSGTTGHAVLDLNLQDNGKRKFILCTNNEDNNDNGSKIAEDICYPRIKKAIKGYTGKKDKKKHIGLGGNLRYFRTSFVPATTTDRNKEKLTRQSVEMLCLKENTFEKVSETKIIKIFRNKDKYTGILFDEMKIREFKKIIKNFKKPVSVYIFSLGDDDFNDEFRDIKNKVKICSIPAAILRVYKRIFK